MASNDNNDIQPDDEVDLNEEASSKGLDKQKIIALGAIVGIFVLAAIVFFALSRKSNSPDSTPEPPLTAEAPPEDMDGEMPPPEDEPADAEPIVPVENPDEPIDEIEASASSPFQDWVQGIIHPIPIPDGLEGTPGLIGSNSPQIQMVQPSIQDTGAAQSDDNAALKQLWERGARAKRNGDIDGARQAWQQILEISPNHPGIQEAINKLNG